MISNTSDILLVTIFIDNLLWVFPEKNIASKIKKLMICEMAVDRPAPVAPIPNPKISIGSPIIFKIPPAVSPIMA